jgi:cell wall-associated NlpC family hydrolase
LSKSRIRRSALPLGALVTVGTIALTGATPALAADAASGTANDQGDAATGTETATVTVSDTESATVTRKATAKATKRLTKKIKATASVTAHSTRTVKATRTVTVTATAGDHETAVAQARAAAKQKARDRARTAAIEGAKKSAVAHAKEKAQTRAKHKAVDKAEQKLESKIISDAAELKGTPYVWGATGPSAFDCSGYVGYVLREAGVTHLNRTSSGLVSDTHRVSKRAKKKGDLVFFSSGGHVYHVGIYAGGGKIWHAPGAGRSVTKASIWTSSYSVGRISV